MANLRGGTIEKQVKDAWHRLEAYGRGRHGQTDHLTHSLELGKKREMYLRDFANYAKEIGIADKLNVAMGDASLMREFLLDRLDGLSRSSAIDYVSGFNSMVQGLREANVTIHKGADYAIKEAREIAKGIEEAARRTGRAIDRADVVISKLYHQRHESGVIAQIQYETGFRTSEAYRLAKNPDNYLKDGHVVGMVGKGNHVYDPKPISPGLAMQIKNLDKSALPSQTTYLKEIKTATNNPDAVAHDFRYTYAKEAMEERLAHGMGYKEALKEVSKELNHHRPEITEHYLKGA